MLRSCLPKKVSLQLLSKQSVGDVWIAAGLGEFRKRKDYRIGTVRYNWPTSAHAS